MKTNLPDITTARVHIESRLVNIQREINSLDWQEDLANSKQKAVPLNEEFKELKNMLKAYNKTARLPKKTWGSATAETVLLEDSKKQLHTRIQEQAQKIMQKYPDQKSGMLPSYEWM